MQILNRELLCLSSIMIKLVVVGYACFTLVVQSARLFSLPFSLIVVLGSIIWWVGILIGCHLLIKKCRLFSHDDWWYFSLLILIAATAGLLACAINAPEEDDSLYVPQAIYALTNPSNPLGFNLNWIVPFASGEQIRTPLAFFSNVIEIFWACLSYLTGVQYLTMYHIIGSFIFGAAFPIIYFNLLSRFSSSTYTLLIGTVSITIAGFLLFRENGIGYGIFLNKIWIGKSILLFLMAPIIAGFAIDFLKIPTPQGWGLVALSSIAATGLSSSSMFLIPLLLSAIAIGYFFQKILTKSVSVQCLRNGISVMAAGFYPGAAGIYFNYTVIVRGQLSNYDNAYSASSVEVFRTGFTPFFGAPLSLTSILVLFSLAYLIFKRKVNYYPLISWSIATIVLFTNPFTAYFVAKYLTSFLVYPRIFLIIPVFTIFGLAIGELARQFEGRINFFCLAILIITLSLGYASFLGTDTLKNRLDVSKFRVLGSPHFGSITPKIDNNLIADVREIEKILPQGNTLASLDYNLVIPMLTTKYKQYFLWPLDVIKFHASTQVDKHEAEIRFNAARYFLGIGGALFQADAAQLLDNRVRNVIVSKRFGNNISDINTLIIGNGLVLLKETNRYALYTR